MPSTTPETPAVAPGAVFEDIGHRAGFDEAFDPSGGIRSHWRPFFEQIEQLGTAEVHRRWEEAQHLIRENGVTYNVYGDPKGTERPWELDPLPLLVSAEDAAELEAGLVQRATLLDRILADLYGPQTLLARGVLPAELVYGGNAFLRACHGWKVPANRYLHLYAADVGRTTDGGFMVLRDRTQAPSGAGYALENRIVLSRMLPEVFRDCRVHRLAGFFRTVRESLRAIAPNHREDPRIVLLTPGPYNETYFEHAYLARYLGYTLVEGADLTVRDNRVYLKLLGGLQQVDVVLRRLDDDYCDPLELRGDSFLGIPGLVQAARSGNVAVANALGSGVIESPTMPAYLPAMCRFLLGEELRLPSVPTWWCGEPDSLRHVLANLPHLVIKPTFRPGRSTSIFCQGLSSSELSVLAERIKARPRDFVGQDQLALSTTAVLREDRFDRRRFLLRSYLTASQDGYAMMPGGLTRIAPSAETLDVSMQKGGGSKDTWFLSDAPVEHVTLLPATVRPVEVRRDGGDLPSRAADDLFWLGRYAERAEGLIRLLRAVLVRMTEKPGLRDVPELPVLLRALTDQSKTLPGFVGAGGEERIAAPAPELLSLLYDSERVGSLASTMDTLHLVASRVRDRISSDMWRIIVGLGLRTEGSFASRRSARRALGDALDLLDRKVLSLAAFSGMVSESMTRGQGRRFLDMGRRIERALHTLGLVRGALTTAQPVEGPLLEAILEIADSAMTYRRRYLSRLQAAPTLDLVLVDLDNPRSFAYQLGELSHDIAALPKSSSPGVSSHEHELIAAAFSRIGTLDVERLAAVDEFGRRPDLEAFAFEMEAVLPTVSDALTRTYLTHLQAARQYASV